MFLNHRIVICALAFLLLLPRSSHAKTVDDSKFGFTLEIPDDFLGDPDLTYRPGNVYAFRKPGVGGHIYDSFIVIQRLYTTIGPRHLTDGDIPKNNQAELINAHWKRLDLDGYKLLEDIEGNVEVSYRAEIPLKGEAVQLSVSGCQRDSEKSHALLNQLLDQLQGPSNLIADGSTADVEANHSDRNTLIGAAVLGIGAMLLLLWVVYQKFPELFIRNASVRDFR